MTDITTGRISFWLYDWGIFPVYTSLKFSNQYTRCVIDQKRVTIHEPTRTIEIPLEAIESCERFAFSQSRGAGSAINLKLSLSKDCTITKGQRETSEVYLVPLDVLAHRISDLEMDTLREVIVAFRQRKSLDVHENPYYRELSRVNRLDEFASRQWQSEVDPRVYTPIPSTGWIVIRLLLIIVGVTAVILLLAGIIFNVFFAP